jgi:hypothetical protein
MMGYQPQPQGSLFYVGIDLDYVQMGVRSRLRRASLYLNIPI